MHANLESFKKNIKKINKQIWYTHLHSLIDVFNLVLIGRLESLECIYFWDYTIYEWHDWWNGGNCREKKVEAYEAEGGMQSQNATGAVR